MKHLAWNALTLSSALAISDAFAQVEPYSGHRGPMGDWGWGWGGMIFGPILMLVFLAAAVAVIMLVVRWIGGGPATPTIQAPGGKTALDILRERYARGEIDTEEFESRKRTLSE
jgi:putative membrane protein